MTQSEALALLDLDENKDLAEQLEFVFFEHKQKIYRQLDQILLFPKCISALKNLAKSAETLKLPFKYEQLKVLNDLPSAAGQTLVEQYNLLQQAKIKAAHLLYNSSSPQNAWEILLAYQLILSKSLTFWSEANVASSEIKLSQQFDPLSILTELKDLERKGICHLNELNEQNTPPSLKEWISWNKALQAKIS